MKPVEILLYREVLPEDGEKFVREITAAGEAPIHLRINSPGGDVFAGNAIYNALLAHAPGVTVTVDGLSASIASLIMLAGKPVRIAANAMVMIHNPSAGVQGGAEKMRRLAGVLDQIRDSLVDAYLRRIGDKMSREDLVATLETDTWLSASDAVKLGLADEVITPEREVTALYDLSKFKGLPFDINARIRAGSPNPIESKFKAMNEADFKALQELAASLEKRIKAKEDEPAPVMAVTDEAFAALDARVKVLEEAWAAMKPADPEPTDATAKLKTEVTNLTAKVTDFTAALAAKDAEIKALKDDAQDVLAKAKVIAPTMAREIGARFGLNKAIEKPKASADDQKPVNHFEVWSGMKDPSARNAYFKANKAAIQAAQVAK